MSALRKLACFGTAVALGIASTVAMAAEVACPPEAAGTARVFYADPGGECWDYATTTENVSGTNGLQFVTLAPNYDTLAERVAASGLQLPNLGTSFKSLGTINDANGQNSYFRITSTGDGVGTFEILTSLVGDFYLLFKTGNNIYPNWAAFRIPAGVTSGEWRIDPTQQLSHASLYGEVPLPAAAWLLISGMLGLFGISRRRAS